MPLAPGSSRFLSHGWSCCMTNVCCTWHSDSLYLVFSSHTIFFFSGKCFLSTLSQMSNHYSSAPTLPFLSVSATVQNNIRPTLEELRPIRTRSTPFSINWPIRTRPAPPSKRWQLSLWLFTSATVNSAEHHRQPVNTGNETKGRGGGNQFVMAP